MHKWYWNARSSSKGASPALVSPSVHRSVEWSTRSSVAWAVMLVVDFWFSHMTYDIHRLRTHRFPLGPVLSSASVLGSAFDNLDLVSIAFNYTFLIL